LGPHFHFCNNFIFIPKLSSVNSILQWIKIDGSLTARFGLYDGWSKNSSAQFFDGFHSLFLMVRFVAFGSWVPLKEQHMP
jgi:hypothetical protein